MDLTGDEEFIIRLYRNKHLGTSLYIGLQGFSMFLGRGPGDPQVENQGWERNYIAGQDLGIG